MWIFYVYFLDYTYFWNINLFIGVTMDCKNIDEFAKQVGGPLRLTSLIISRARQVIKKSPQFVEAETDDPVQIAFLEFMQGKIRLREAHEQPPQIPELQKIEPPEEASEKS